MKVLLCVLDAPTPPLNGLRLPLFHLHAELARRHELRVVGFRKPEHAASPGALQGRWLEPPVPRTAGTLRATGAFVRGRPLRADGFARALGPALAEEASRMRPDVVWVFSWRLASVWRHVPTYPRMLTALDAGHRNVEARADVAAPLHARLLRMEARHVRRFVVDEFARYEKVVVVTDQDRRAIEELAPSLSLAVIPNGVQADAFDVRVEVDEHRVAFHGVLNYAPNVSAAARLAEEILPRIQRRRPDAHLALVGRDPSPAVRELTARRGVQVTGAVAEIAPWLAGSAVYVCPMATGTGIKNKVLEAMAAGVPCVTTPLALQGLQVEHDVHVLVAESDDELARAALRVMEDRQLARRLSAAAASYVRQHHTWAAMASAYERLLEELAGVHA
jgi:polysaccharide biosynthesis protein PslH